MKLSILIAAYNVQKYIEKCIESCYIENISDQYEIIVINDGSTDRTLEIINSIVVNISNLRIINKKNEGLGTSRNIGIAEAKGDFLWMIDGDDFIETSKLAAILEIVDSNEADIYCVNYNITNAKGDIINTAYNISRMQEIYDATIYYTKFMMNSYTWQYIFKREIFRLNNISFMPNINMQDSEILPKIIYYSNQVIYLPIIAYNYVQHSSSFTNSKNFEKRLHYFKSIIEVNKSLLRFKDEVEIENKLLATAVIEKKESLQNVLLNHLIFFNYNKLELLNIINLLKNNNLYPLNNALRGKMKLIQIGINHYPLSTKWLLDNLQTIKKKLKI